MNENNAPGANRGVRGESAAHGTASVPGESTDDQLDLFATADDEDTDNRLTSGERFDTFHSANPAVYATLVRLAREWVRATGRHRVGIDMLCARCRWDIALRTSDPDFKINNNFKPYYARLIQKQEADLVDLFEVRRSGADEWINRQAA